MVEQRRIGWLARMAALGLCALMTSVSAAKADLQDIMKAGVVRIGVPVDVPPFGSIDKNQQPAGLDIEMAKLVAKELGVKLEMQQITGANRIPYLMTNKLDIVISVMGATPERAKQIAFTSPYAALFIGVFGPADAKVTKPDEIGSLRVGVARGTTQDIELTRLAPKATIVRFDDDATTAAAYLAGQVDLFATANVVAEDLTKKNPDKGFDTKFVMRYSPCHMGIRHGNPELLRWLDTFIFYNRMNGTLNRLSEQWIGKPFPENLPTM
jgi:polar amino acid transport system substrate-binding protein